MTTQSGPGVRRGQTQIFKLAWTVNTGMSPARLPGPLPRTEVLVCVCVCERARARARVRRAVTGLRVCVCVCLAGTARGSGETRIARPSRLSTMATSD